MGFFAEAGTVKDHWKTSLHCGGLVTLVAGVHYMYMREYWVQVGKTPVVYRYIDWSITVPLQMIEFNLILRAANKPTSAASFWKLLLGTVIMLSFGYAGEIDVFPAPGRWVCFGLGWSIYPLGYFFGYLLNSVDETFLNVIYNIADFVNKIAFVLSCWSCAKADSEKAGVLLG